MQGGRGGCVWFLVGWVRRGYAVVETTDKDVIAFCGEMEFVSPVQIWIIQGGMAVHGKKQILETILEPENK